MGKALTAANTGYETHQKNTSTIRNDGGRRNDGVAMWQMGCKWATLKKAKHAKEKV